MVDFSGNLAFGAFLSSLWCWSGSTRTRNAVALDLRWLVAAVGALALAFAVWNTAKTDRFGCFPDSLYQGHGVWHLLCAVSAYCLFRLYVSEEPLSSPPGRDLPSTASGARA